MRDRKLIAVPCKLSPGMFSSELVFAVTMANGEVYRGITPRHFCWNDQGRPVREEEVTAEVGGMVAAKLVDDELGGNQVAVEVPDGEVIAVKERQVRPRPTEIKPPEVSTHTERARNVPV